jgi:RNA recognition motif-containing protein
VQISNAEETMKNLYVGNMERTTTEQDLRTAFGIYGPVELVTIITDRTTGTPRGFGFVEMSADKDAQEAILGLNGSLMAGRTIVVGEAHPKTNNDRTRTST